MSALQAILWVAVVATLVSLVSTLQVVSTACR